MSAVRSGARTRMHVADEGDAYGGPVRRLTGRWRIVEMDLWDREAIRGWVELGPGGALLGHIDVHLGDDSGFRAVRDAACR